MERVPPAVQFHVQWASGSVAFSSQGRFGDTAARLTAQGLQPHGLGRNVEVTLASHRELQSHVDVISVSGHPGGVASGMRENLRRPSSRASQHRRKPWGRSPNQRYVNTKVHDSLTLFSEIEGFSGRGERDPTPHIRRNVSISK